MIYFNGCLCMLDDLQEIMTQATEDMKKELGEEFELQYRKGVPSGIKNRYRPSAWGHFGLLRNGHVQWLCYGGNERSIHRDGFGPGSDCHCPERGRGSDEIYQVNGIVL